MNSAIVRRLMGSAISGAILALVVPAVGFSQAPDDPETSPIPPVQPDPQQNPEQNPEAQAPAGFESPTAAAEAFLAAVKAKDVEKMKAAFSPAQRRRVGEQYALLFNYITIHEYKVGEAKEIGEETIVDMKWKITVDADALIDKVVDMMLASQQEMMPEFEPTDDDRAMFKELLKGMSGDLQPKLEAENQQLKVAQVEGRWYVIGTTHQLPNLPGMSGDEDDGDNQGNPDGQENAEEPAADTWGGETPEALFRRVVENWKSNNTDDLQWCMRPGTDRQAYNRAPKVLILCLSVQDYRVAEVTIDEETAKIKFRWTANFDSGRYTTLQLAALRESSEAQGITEEQIDRMVRLYTPRIRQEADFWKRHIEKRDHTMTAIKHAERWFVLQPFEPPDAPNGHHGDNGNNSNGD